VKSGRAGGREIRVAGILYTIVALDITSLIMGSSKAFKILVAFVLTCCCPTKSFVAVRPKLSRQIDSNRFRDAITSAWPINDGLQIHRESDEPKIGVLLLNLGGPETGDDVEGKALRVMREPRYK
jgi:hypothetical protein